MASDPHSNSADTAGWSLLAVSEKRTTLIAATFFANVVIAVMGDLLFAGGSRVMSIPGGGIDARFASLRAFTTDTLADGQLPLWNPTVFSGMAHIGGFESSLYYPPNLVYQILPIAPAINFGIALHLFLFAMFTFLWLRRHQLHPVASIYGGVAAMLSGVFFLHAPAGDLTVLEAFTWCPAAFMAIHSLARGQLATGVIGGVLAITMQILCGYPVASVYTVFPAMLYGAFLFSVQADRGAMVRGGLLIVALAPFLAAIQLWAGAETFSQSTRLHGDAASFIAAKAFAPRDILSAAAPWAEAVTAQTQSIFVGVITILSAAFGLLFGTGRLRYAAAIIAGILLATAYLPGLPFFVESVPAARYILEPNLMTIPAMLFVIAMGCVGMDRLIRYPSSAMHMAGVAIGFTVALGVAALFAHFTPGISESTLRGLLMAAGVTLCAAALLSLVPINAWFRFAVLAVGIAELYVFAVLHRPSMKLDSYSGVQVVGNSDRVLNLEWINPAPGSMTYYASGNAALPSQRYMALLAHTQWGALSENWSGPFEFVGYHPLHRMLRVTSVVATAEAAPEQNIDDRLPRFVLISDYIVESNRDAAFAAMDQPTFDPWRTVILEESPTPTPQGETGDVAIAVTDESVNELNIELSLERPAILLMTDAYDRGWRAWGLSGSSQWRYDVLPANVALRAIPLGAGVHRIHLEYAPLTFRIGQWVSVATAAGFVVFGFAAVRRRKRESPSGAPAKHSR